MSLGAELNSVKDFIRDKAQQVGLDFFEVIFEMVNANQMNAIAAYGGFPNRYPHWRFGMEYERLNKTYTYGFSKIYEMVVNNDPCYAYLMKANSFVDQKLVMAHVYGHSDFFKNNIYFAHTNRKMMDKAGNHRTRIQRMMSRYGQDTVEDFIDICLSLETLVDINGAIRTPLIPPAIESQAELPKSEAVDGLKPNETISETLAEARIEKDVLLYLLENASLYDWQQEVLSIVRDEAYYFAPQRQSKIMNEGWASYWHSHLMTKHILNDEEIFDYADRHSGSMQTSGGNLNPYKVGIELFRDIEQRWNKGQFGRDYDECGDMHDKENWDKQLGLGREKIFEVRRLHNDVSFLDTFLTPDFCERMEFFTYDYDDKSDQFQVKSREFKEVKQKLLQMLTNGGNPIIGVVPGMEPNPGELYLRHQYEGVDLQMDYAKETLKNLYQLWRRPVSLETLVDDVTKIISFDGSEVRERRLS